MEMGLLHGHKTLAYLMFGLALLNVVLVLMPTINAKVVELVHKILLNLGRLTLLIGFGLWMTKWSAAPILQMWWAWTAILLWGPMEVVAKRLVKPDLKYVLEGGGASKKLLIGAALELLIVVCIFGMMSVKSMRPILP